MVHKTMACLCSSAQPPPRRMTPREASIIHVVGRSCARYQKNGGIESKGNTYPERKIDGRTVKQSSFDANTQRLRVALPNEGVRDVALVR